MPDRAFHLVRHVAWNKARNEPEVEAAAQLEAAREQLAPVLGERAVILSSRAERAMHTAQGLAAGLDLQVFPSVRMELGGLYPSGIRELDTFVDEALAETGVGLGETTPLIVVTHQPLVDIAKGGETAYGEVVLYQPGSWQNQKFSDMYEQGLQRQIDAGLAG